jgi:hypothetical protein
MIAGMAVWPSRVGTLAVSWMAPRRTGGHHVPMASFLEVVNGVGSVAGILGIGYQVYTTQRDRAERRRNQAPTRGAPVEMAPPAAPASRPGSASVPGSGPVGGAYPPTTAPPPPRGSAEPESDVAFWFGLAAPFLMGAYLWLTALGASSYITNLSLAGGTPEAAQSQVRYTTVLMIVNAVWAAALAYKHSGTRPMMTRFWVYGLASLASLGSAIGLLAVHSSIIFS